jgi:hypothetical protein
VVISFLLSQFVPVCTRFRCAYHCSSTSIPEYTCCQAQTSPLFGRFAYVVWPPRCFLAL